MKNQNTSENLETLLFNRRNSFLTWLGILAAAFSTLNLFGTIGVIGLSEWFENLLYAYSVVVHSLAKLVLRPIEFFYEIKFLSWHLDLIVISFFFLNRFITDLIFIILTEVVFTRSVPLEDNDFEKWPRVRKLFDVLKKWEDSFAIIFGKIGFFVQKIFTLIIVVWLVYAFFDSEPPTLSPEYPVWSPIAWFFMAMYAVPLFVILLYLLLVIGTLINYPIDLAISVLRRKNKPALNFPSVKYLKLVKSQFIYDVKFTFAFLALIGVNYQLYDISNL